MKPALVIVDMQEVLVPLMWRGPELADLIAGTRLSARLRLQPQDVVIQKSATDGFYGSDLASGDPEAGLTAEQIVRRHNRILSAMYHPGGTVTVRSSGTIFT